jgi:ketosteroid isomerase-like protein
MMHASSMAETKVGRYNNEYALFLDFTDDGRQIKRIEEFADSAYSADFFAKLGILS